MFLMIQKLVDAWGKQDTQDYGVTIIEGADKFSFKSPDHRWKLGTNPYPHKPEWLAVKWPN